MRQITYEAHGPPEQVLRCVHVDNPQPGPGQVSVALEAAAVHPADILTVLGEYAARPRFPGAVPGSEGVGRIAAVGDGVDRTVGQRVLLPLGSGTWRDRVVVPASHMITVSETLDAAQLAMAIVNPVTAQRLLTQHMALRPGEWVLQNAANSAVGRLVAAEAKERGIHTVNFVRRADAGIAVRNAGGDVVIAEAEDPAAEVRAYTDGAQIRLALDAVGGRATEHLAACLGHAGTLVSYGALSGDACRMSPAQLIFRDIRLRGFWLASWWRDATIDTRAAAIRTHLDALARGERQIPIAGVYSLDQATAAIRHATQSHKDGKVILTGEAYAGT